MTVPEFSRPVLVDRIGVGGSAHTLEATAAECRALAARLAIPDVKSFACRFALARGPDTARGEIVADGVLKARLTRTCVVTLDDFETDTMLEFRLHFVVDGTEQAEDDPEDDDELPYSGGAIDLGEAAAEQLALDLDPYPRKPGAVLADEAQDAVPSPFASLTAIARRK